MLYSLSFLEPGQPWPPESERGRIDLYTENKNLFDGEIEAVWADLKKYLRKGELSTSLDFLLNYPTLITQKTADLIVGEPPHIELENEVNEARLEEITDRTRFLEVLESLIVNVDSMGDGVLKIVQAPDGKTKILNVSPANWYPVVKQGTDEIVYHVLAFKQKIGEESFLEVEIHGKNEGSIPVIEHRLYRLNESSTVVATSSGLSSVIGERLLWEGEVDEIEANPTDGFLVIDCHNYNYDSIYGKSSYSKALKSILKKLIIRYALENEVLDTFSRPTFFGPRELQDLDPITKKPIFRPGGYIALNPDPGTTPVLPAGLVWDAHLGESDISKRSLMDRLFDASEMSPVLFAGNLAGMAESGTALRLRLTNTLAKCSRIRRKVDLAARKALSIALMLEGTDPTGLYIEWQDGLPTINLEQAQEFALWANTPQFAGEKGGAALLKRFGYSEEEANEIMADSSRNGGMGGMI